MRVTEGAPSLACPWHGWEYDLRSGRSLAGPQGPGLGVTLDLERVRAHSCRALDPGKGSPAWFMGVTW